MLKIVNRMQARDERGFTLVELLIVIAIIAILAAIAIPQFASYRQRGIRSSMQADARNIATMEEAVFGDTQSYSDPGAIGAGATFTLGSSQSGRMSSGNSLAVKGTPTAYTIEVTNANGGSGSTCYYQMNNGATAFGATCP